MTRKHYRAIAAALAACKPLIATGKQTTFDDSACEAQWRKTVQGVTCALQAACPRFNRSRFLAACGYQDEPPPSASGLSREHEQAFFNVACRHARRPR